MPSIASHLAVAKLVLNKLNIKNKITYYQGAVLPDILDKKNTHYKYTYKIFLLPDINEYLKISNDNDSFKIGYLVHLLLDKYYMLEYVNKELIIKKHKDLSIFEDKSIYNDYTMINNRLLKDFKIKKTLINKIMNFNNYVVDNDKYNINLKAINSKEKGTLNHIDYDCYKKFLINISDKIVDEINKLIIHNRLKLSYRKYLILKENVANKYISNLTIINKSFYKDKNNLVKIENNSEYNIKIIYLINIFKYSITKDFIDITKNKYFNNKIKLTQKHLILEGSDGVGKTTTARLLLKKGILSYDRNLSVICKYMDFNISEEERIKKYTEYLTNNDVKVVFLVLNNKKELMKRINRRKNKDKFDQDAFKYNELYLKTYQSLKHLSNLYLVDCYNKTRKEIVKEIINML